MDGRSQGKDVEGAEGVSTRVFYRFGHQYFAISMSYNQKLLCHAVIDISTWTSSRQFGSLRFDVQRLWDLAHPDSVLRMAIFFNRLGLGLLKPRLVNRQRIRGPGRKPA